MSNTRIKYYSVSDLSIPYYLSLINNKLDNFDIGFFNTVEINDYLEFYNIIKFYDNQLLNKKYQSIVELIKEEIFKYFSKNIETLDVLNNINRIYLDDFWELFDICKLYLKIDDTDFSNALSNNIDFILLHKNTVYHYENLIDSFLNNYDKSGEFVINNEFINNEKKIYFPKQFNKKQAINTYIDSADPNLSFLSVLFSTKKSNEIIDDSIKLRAIKRYKEIYENNKQSMIEIKTGFNIKFDENQKNSKVTYVEKRIINVSYSLNDILDFKNDNRCLFIYYLINVMELIDKQGRINILPNSNDEPALERYTGFDVKNFYYTGTIFSVLQGINIYSIYMYDDILKERCNTDMETLIKWYFEEYIVEYFNINGFVFNVSKSSNYIEKIRNLVAEFDSILKQYSLYCLYRNIDRELLELNHSQVRFDSIPSLIDNKYIYIKDNKLLEYAYLISSDQSRLSSPINKKTKYNSFFENIKYDNVSKLDYHEINYSKIDELISAGVIGEEDNTLVNTNLSYILNDYFHKEFLTREVIEKYNIQLYDYEYYDGLFSKEECNYLNYSLNDQQFGNNLGIRNRYIHGTNSLNKDINIQDYYHVLYLLLCTILKINYELVLVSN